VASLSQGRTAAAQCGLFTYKSVPVIFEPPCTFLTLFLIVFTLQGKDARKLAGNWFQLLMVLFTKEYLPTSVLCANICTLYTY